MPAGIDETAWGRRAIRVRVASVVVDPAGGSAILALTPASRCAAALSRRPSPSWATLAVYIPESEHGVARIERLRDATALTLRRRAAGVVLDGDGVDVWLLLAVVPREVPG